LCWLTVEQQFNPALAIASAVSIHIMKKTYFVLLGILTLVISFSCEKKRLYDDAKIANEIINEVAGTSGELINVEDKLAKTDDKKYFIELKVNGSKMIHEQNTEKAIVASYCASQLYMRLDPSTIEKNYGFNIIFDTEEDPLNTKKYFYEKPELKQACKAFDNIDNYLKYLSTDDTVSASTLIDTNYFPLNVMELNRKVRNKIGISFVKTFHFYSYYELTNKAGTKVTPCFNIVTVITRQDSSQTKIESLNPIYKSGSKMININPFE